MANFPISIILGSAVFAASATVSASPRVYFSSTDHVSYVQLIDDYNAEKIDYYDYEFYKTPVANDSQVIDVPKLITRYEVPGSDLLAGHGPDIVPKGRAPPAK